ncbi:MAG TPA: barstar family protein [Kofleriaceae bacterium]|nr:barstar family protein [Kofleriaceae bacterium]
MPKPVFEIDGRKIDSLEAFFDEVSKVLVTALWGRNLDAFNDVLRGGFGTPDGGFVLRWINSAESRVALGYGATVRYLELKSSRCHPDSVAYVAAELDAARQGEGQTIFDVLVEIIRSHGPGGDEQEDGVELELR